MYNAISSSSTSNQFDAKRKQFINIDGGLRYQGSSSQFRINLSQTVENIRYISLEMAVIPYTFYNVPSNYHVPLHEQGQTTVNVQVTPGMYNPQNLAAALAAELTAFSPTGATYTVTYNNITGKYTISSTTQFSLDWTTDTYPPPSGNYNYNRNYMYAVLGFNTGSPLRQPDPDTGYALTHTSSGVGILGFNTLYLKITSVPSNYTGADNIPYFAVIPVEGNAYDRIIWRRNDHYDQYTVSDTKGVNLRELYVELLYADGSPVDLNGGNIVFVLSVEHHQTQSFISSQEYRSN